VRCGDVWARGHWGIRVGRGVHAGRRARLARCNSDMGWDRLRLGTRPTIVVLLVLATACSTTGSPASPSSVPSIHAPAATNVSVAGGCSGTSVSTAEPPVWAQRGFSIARGSPWVPWALGKPGDAIAYLFASQFVAEGRRPDGTQNKVLWVVRDGVVQSRVKGHPLGQSQPVVSIDGGPSIVDVPTAGCWTFQVSWGSDPIRTSVINLEVLPAGTLPQRAPGVIPAGHSPG
jgi:hypothetical protein